MNRTHYLPELLPKLTAANSGINLILLGCLLAHPSLALSSYNTRWQVYGEIRSGGASMTNYYDLDSGNPQDEGSWLLGHVLLDAGYRLTPRISLLTRLEWRGPAHYDLILGGDRLQTLAGPLEQAQGEEAVPELSRLWLWASVIPNRLTVEAGLLPSPFMESLGLSNKHENYGLILTALLPPYRAVLHWEAVGRNSRWRLGRDTIDDEYTTLENVKADYVALAVSRSKGWATTMLYASVLDDRTPATKRRAAFGDAIDKDRLGTYGVRAAVESYRVLVTGEIARNFGGAEFQDQTVFAHTGYCFSLQAQAYLGFLRPFVRHLTATGNRMTEDSYRPGLLPAQDYRKFKFEENHAFSAYSPGGLDLYATRYPYFIGPLLATGSSYAAVYGIKRPGVFGDPHSPSDLVLNGIGLTVTPQTNVDCTVTYWQISSQQPAMGIVDGEITKLSKDLGTELDFSLNFRPRRYQGFNLALTIAHFTPGRYYDTRREDPDYYLIYPIVNDTGATDAAVLYDVALTYSW